MNNIQKKLSMTTFPAWFKEKITEEQYMWYILQGYEIEIEVDRITFYINKKLHREDGPALICSNGTKKWFIDNEFHRTDGPAVEWWDNTTEWWIDGKKYPKDKFHAIISKIELDQQ